MDAIFHFGMTKTGSTSIQKTLANLPSEAGNGFVYFTPGGRTNSNWFIDVLYPRNGESIKTGRKLSGDLASEQSAFRDLLRQEAANPATNRWVLSSESLMYEK